MYVCMYGGVPVSFISDKERDALYPRLAAHAASKAAAVAAFRPLLFPRRRSVAAACTAVFPHGISDGRPAETRCRLQNTGSPINRSHNEISYMKIYNTYTIIYYTYYTYEHWNIYTIKYYNKSWSYRIATPANMCCCITTIMVVVTKKNAFYICHPGEGTKIRDQKKAPKNVRVYGEKVLNVVAVIINNMTPPQRSLQVIACINTYINIYNIYVCVYAQQPVPKIYDAFLYYYIVFL